MQRDHSRSGRSPARSAMTPPPPMGSDAWMLQQQLKAETEVQAWRQLRQESQFSQSLSPAQRALDYHHSGSVTLKALVRFGLATLGAHAAWLTAVAAQLGQFEVWLAMIAGFVVTLALSMFAAARGFVHLLAQAAGWMIVAAVALSSLWLAFQFLSEPSPLGSAAMPKSDPVQINTSAVQ